ncbi:MAG: FAD-dependent oxidoreductase, partial [Pseudomonadota bacterium]
MSDTTDVIIIGAGSAGLSAAKALAARGLRFVVLEGAHRIGGRAYSEEIAPGVWFDLGCSWLVGGADNPFTPIADRMGIKLGKEHEDAFRTRNVRFHRNGARLNAEENAQCLEFYAQTYKVCSRAAAEPADTALSDIIELEHEFAPPFLGGISTSWGLDADGISTFDNESSVGGLGYPVLRGYGNLVADWGADVPVT